MKLHELTKSSGRSKKNNRRGRGDASGRGNYSGKGHKGQKARSGGGVRPQFEGGQTSLFMRLPKLKGFKRHYKLVTNYVAVNLADLEQNDLIKDGDTVTKETLAERGIIRMSETIKLLGKGGISKKLTIEGIEAASKSAIQAVEAAGGSVSLAS